MKSLWEKIRDVIMKSPILFSIAAALVPGMLLSVIENIFVFAETVFYGNVTSLREMVSMMAEMPIMGIILGVFIIYPVILTGINLVGVIVLPKDRRGEKKKRIFEIITILLGSSFTMLFLGFTNIHMNANWDEQLYNAQIHQPLWTDGIVTVLVLCAVGLAGYLILSGVRLEKLPPLVVVLSISAMYLGTLECILWSIQTMSVNYWVLSVFPANCVLITVKTIRQKIIEWNRMERNKEDEGSEKSVWNRLNKILGKAEIWPVLALVLMWPLLGILLCILILFGQKPDAVIKAWTETAEWRLSTKTAPPNLYYDEHYLCTVAAGGHEKIVKPIRMGERHGHRVVVNRQLCIANAFEQILEERTPKFHKRIRHFYDTYGFPVARLIRTKGAADVVYLIMKPLEWIFLFVIYLCDAKPEDRIAVQYLPKRAWHESIAP